MKSREKTALIILVSVVLLNLALALIKLYVGMSSNSICIMLDATNSFFDILSGLVAVAAFVLMLKPRRGFPLGRGEYVSGFVVAVLAVVFGCLFLIRSVNRLMMPEPVWYTTLYCVLVAVAATVKLGIGISVFFANKKLNSKSLSAIALDSFLDTGVTVAALVSFAVTANEGYAVDAVFGIVISSIVIIYAAKMVFDNGKLLLVGDSAEKECAVVEQLCAKDSRIIKVGKVTLHDYGFHNKVGTVEVEYRYGTTAEEAAVCSQELSKTIKEECGAEVMLVPVRRP